MTSLTWPCDGKCGAKLTEGRDHFYQLEITQPGLSEGETIRLCEKCAKAQLRPAKDIKNDQPNNH